MLNEKLVYHLLLISCQLEKVETTIYIYSFVVNFICVFSFITLHSSLLARSKILFYWSIFNKLLL